MRNGNSEPALRVEDFTLGKAYSIIFDLKADLAHGSLKGKRFSDVVDSAGNQYVDLVQEGGGVLGIALLGYTYVLEQMGLRFFSLAGTSAGAINTLMIAAHGPVQAAKTERVLTRLANKNLSEFADGAKPQKALFEAGKRLMHTMSTGNVIQTLWRVWRNRQHLSQKMGLHPGADFLSWVQVVLAEEGIVTTADLTNLRAQRPEGGLLIHPDRKDADTNNLNPRLVLVSADITTSTRVLFPEMAQLYWAEPEQVSPAYYVRASMAVPGFFEPLRLEIGSEPSEATRKAWHEMARFDGLPPESAVLVDGGLFSNFPIDVFHNPTIVPRLPTFGVKLSPFRNKARVIDSPANFGSAMLDSTRRVLDFEFFLRNRDYRQLVALINTEGFDWLNFDISNAEKLGLFERGAEAADTFLRQFDWPGYKLVRQQMLDRIPRGAAPVSTPGTPGEVVNTN